MFKIVLDDYLNKNDINNIFIFTDEKKTFEFFKEAYGNNYKILYTNDFKDSDDILFSNNSKNNIDIDHHLKMSIIDPLIMSKTKVVFKTSSQFSAWAKIHNPNLEIYRISAFKYDWFPDSRIPLYKTNDIGINNTLQILYKEEHNIVNKL